MPGGQSTSWRSLLLALLGTSASVVSAQNCISLTGSSTCPGFSTASISTDSALVGLYPFLSLVTDTASFDQQLSAYISQGYVQEKYIYLFGCSNVNLDNTTDYYARYTTSFLCNGIVQNSRVPCGLTGNALRPLCADSCADLALTEEEIATNSQLCQNPNSNYIAQIRADFTNCALPANSLSGASCIEGSTNEPDNCGFSSNLQALCNFCRASAENTTDSCCVTSQAETRCQNVKLPVFSSIPNLLSTSTGTSSATSSPTSTAAAGTSSKHGLSGGQIAGIVVGSILGFLLLLGLLICLFMRRKRRGSDAGSILNQPSPQRQGIQSMTYNPPPTAPQGYEVLPGGRVARMSALQGPDGDDSPQIGLVAGSAPRAYQLDSDPYGESPDPQAKMVVGGIATAKRDGSLSAHSSQPGGDSSPHSGSAGNYSSPEGVASGQSEQLPFFKDYYSAEDIHPNDKVSVLWAYQPRAGDEFELERGDMLKVVGIWDDGWATGVRIDDRAEDYDGKHKAQRDSGVSNGSGVRPESPAIGEVKAFPLVCVCLPDAWKKTVEGDTSTESGSGGPPT